MEGLRYLVLGVFAGMSVCMEMSLNSLLGRHVGVLRSTLAPFITGLIALLIILFFVTGERLGSLNPWMKAPWYSLFGGLFAAIFVAINIFIIPIRFRMRPLRLLPCFLGPGRSCGRFPKKLSRSSPKRFRKFSNKSPRGFLCQMFVVRYWVRHLLTRE